MNFRETKSAKNLNLAQIHNLMGADEDSPHIHVVDFPYRITSTWEDQDCELGIWSNNQEILAWAVFQPAWWNLDYVIHPTKRGTELEKEIFTWGKKQIVKHAKKNNIDFYGSVEIFDDTPQIEQTIANLKAQGFKEFDWSILRFEMELKPEVPNPELSDGYTIRPIKGKEEVAKYVALQNLTFGTKNMTVDWRMRTIDHPAYRSEIDFVIENPEKELVGFCICWLWNDIGQIEPLGVHPEYQGKGFGKALEFITYQKLKSLGAKRIKVDHASFNDKAIALSLKTGFKQKHNALRFYIDTSEWEFEAMSVVKK
jgi:ribosomal protein S18 acetylase RimI-like enzyme